jgi:hypothetical protein
MPIAGKKVWDGRAEYSSGDSVALWLDSCGLAVPDSACRQQASSHHRTAIQAALYLWSSTPFRSLDRRSIPTLSFTPDATPSHIIWLLQPERWRKTSRRTRTRLPSSREHSLLQHRHRLKLPLHALRLSRVPGHEYPSLLPQALRTKTATATSTLRPGRTLPTTTWKTRLHRVPFGVREVE